MRRLFIGSLMLFQALMAHSNMAQSPTRAVTDAGQKVLLFHDGTWKPDATEPPTATPVGVLH